MGFNINRKKKKSGGVLAGILLFIIGIVLLWWNEGRTVKTESSILEVEKNYVEVDSTKVDNTKDGKIVYTHGKLVYDENGVVDDMFNVQVDSAVLSRIVEMYQWKEDCDTDDDGYENCTYSKVWSTDIINSNEFQDSSHQNPNSMQYNSQKLFANYIKLDAYDMDYFKNSFSTKLTYTNLTEEEANNHGLYVNGEYYTTIEPKTTEEIGDIRIKFMYNDAKELSVIGMQSNDKIVAYTASNDYKVSKMKETNATASELISDLRSENNTLKWIFRLVGTLLIVFGLMAMISPLQRLASFIPFLGRIFNAVSGFIMALIGLCISLVVIAIAWFRFRPVLSIILIVVIVGIIVLIRNLKKKKKASLESENMQQISNDQIQTPIQDNQTQTLNQQVQTPTDQSNNNQPL